MGTSWSDAADTARDIERGETALTEALNEAEKIAARFTDEHSESQLQPEVRVDLDIGGDDQPLFVFSIDVDLADDLDADEYPLAEIQKLTSALRSQIAASIVVGWAWLVTAGTKSGVAH